jgi:polyferredoxin
LSGFCGYVIFWSAAFEFLRILKNQKRRSKKYFLQKTKKNLREDKKKVVEKKVLNLGTKFFASVFVGPVVWLLWICNF